MGATVGQNQADKRAATQKGRAVVSAASGQRGQLKTGMASLYAGLPVGFRLPFLRCLAAGGTSWPSGRTRDFLSGQPDLATSSRRRKGDQPAALARGSLMIRRAAFTSESSVPVTEYLRASARWRRLGETTQCEHGLDDLGVDLAPRQILGCWGGTWGGLGLALPSQQPCVDSQDVGVVRCYTPRPAWRNPGLSPSRRPSPVHGASPRGLRRPGQVWRGPWQLVCHGPCCLVRASRQLGSGDLLLNDRPALQTITN